MYLISFMASQKQRTPMVKSDVDAIFEDCKDLGLLIGKGGKN